VIRQLSLELLGPQTGFLKKQQTQCDRIFASTCVALTVAKTAPERMGIWFALLSEFRKEPARHEQWFEHASLAQTYCCADPRRIHFGAAFSGGMIPEEYR